MAAWGRPRNYPSRSLNKEEVKSIQTRVEGGNSFRSRKRGKKKKGPTATASCNPFSKFGGEWKSRPSSKWSGCPKGSPKRHRGVNPPETEREEHDARVIRGGKKLDGRCKKKGQESSPRGETVNHRVSQEKELEGTHETEKRGRKAASITHPRAIIFTTEVLGPAKS